MCGRIELIDGKRIFLRYPVANTGTKGTAIPADAGDIRPTQQVLMITPEYVLTTAKWGLVPPWASDPRIGSKMFNARAEGIATKPSFKRPLRFQRCIVPASGFFEWKGQPGAKTKYRIGRKDGELFGFAGLYDTWRDRSGGDGSDGELTTCTIITTEPNALMAPIHARMPVLLLPEDEERWLNPDMTEPDEVVRLLKPYPAELMEAQPA